MRFGQLILGKITKVVATRCQILRLKCAKIDFGWGGKLGLSSRTRWGAYSAPPESRPPSWNIGDLLLREGGCRRGRQDEGRGAEEKEEEAGGPPYVCLNFP